MHVLDLKTILYRSIDILGIKTIIAMIKPFLEKAKTINCTLFEAH
jgi:hypothetical protein